MNEVEQSESGELQQLESGHNQDTDTAGEHIKCLLSEASIRFEYGGQPDVIIGTGCGKVPVGGPLGKGSGATASRSIAGS